MRGKICRDGVIAFGKPEDFYLFSYYSGIYRDKFIVYW